MEGIVQAVAFATVMVFALGYILFGRSAGKLLLWVLLPAVLLAWVYYSLAR